MSLPRHFSQRPRYRLSPPPQRGVAGPVEAPVSEEVEVMEAMAEIIEAAPVVVEPVIVEPEVVVVEPVVEVEPEVIAATPAKAATWNVAMKKADLLAIALGLGLAVTDDNTKADIVEALRSA